jgi:LysR family glycine cleavage system transcriptional activator/LysR family transcriptional regulator of beta-lactamase
MISREATLIVVPHLASDWDRWFDAAGVRTPTRPGGEVFFDNNAMAIQAVLDGVGVAIAQPLYVTDALASGRLVAPLPIIATKREGWYFEYRPSRAEEPALIAFRQWLYEETRRQREVEAELMERSLKPGERKQTTPLGA